MADFKIDKQVAEVIIQGDSITTEGPVVHHGNPDQVELAARLDELLSEIEDKVRSGTVDRTIGAQTQALVREASTELASEQPRSSRLKAVLGQARQLIDGVASMAGVVQSVDKLIKLLGGS
jgi:hypothetical protein